MVCDHIEDGTSCVGKVFIRSQRHGGDQFVIDGGGLVRMGDDNGFPAVQIGHQRFQLRITEILTVAVGGKFDAIGTKNFQGIFRFFNGEVYIRQRKGRTEHELAWIQGFQRRGFLVELTADAGRFSAVSKVWLRRRHREHGSPDSGSVHKLQMSFRAPCRDGETLIHFHSMGFNGLQIRIRNHVAVHIDLRTARKRDNH